MEVLTVLAIITLPALVIGWIIGSHPLKSIAIATIFWSLLFLGMQIGNAH